MRWKRTTTLFLATLVVGVSPLAVAMEPIPETPGWRGFVVLGAGYVDLKSNVLAGNDLIDIGNPVVDSIARGPESDDTVHPVITGEVTYTFETGLQAFFGTTLEDAVTLDAVSQLGLRKNIGNAGVLQGGLLFSGIRAEVWEDPYAEGVPREKTDRDGSGARLQWDRIWGSAFEMTFSYRDLSFDSERSGQGVVSVDCDLGCEELLRRDGDQYLFDVSYLYRLGAGRNHLLRPAVRYTVDDREGSAVSSDAYRLQLSYVYASQAYTITSNIAFGSVRRDEPSPIFGVRTDADRFAIDTTLFYRLPAQSGRWQAVASVFWGDEDADVAFHDNRLMMISIGAMYRFGSR